MKKRLFFLRQAALFTFSFPFFTFSLFAQKDTTRFFAEAGGVVATGSSTPFWLRANQYGTVPLQNPFGFVRAGGQTTLGTNPRQAQLHLQTELVANLGQSSHLLLPVASATFRYRRFEAYVGRRKEFFGLGDTLLTSGSYAWSGNALPLPKVQVGTRGFVPLGFTKGLFSLHAMMAHGWFINADSVKNSYLHQKAVFIRLGKPAWKVHFYAGVQHLAQWGGQWRHPVLGSNLTLADGKLPSDFAAFFSVFKASEPPVSSTVTVFDAANRTGNHLGSIDFAVDYHGAKGNWLFYYQHPYEDKSGVFFINFPDGLYGLRWKNTNTAPASFKISRLTAEFLTTMDQSGFDINIKNRRFDGADSYFENWQYQEGWTYQQRVIGTPFITRRWDTRPELYSVKGGHPAFPLLSSISSNRVQLIHLGVIGTTLSGVICKLLISQSWNFGRPVVTDPAFPLTQFSGLFELSKALPKNGLFLQATVSIDKGPWLPDNAGLRLSIRKSGWL